MAFFKNLWTSIKSTFGNDDERQENGLAKQRNTIADYQQATTQNIAKTSTTQAPSIPKQNETPTPTQTVTTQLKSPYTPPHPKVAELTEVSDIVEYEVSRQSIAQLDILVDSLGLVKRKIVCDRGVITLPFDASGCDFETKRQLAHASANEFNIDAHTLPNNIACAEVAKRAFSGIKASREECFVCGNLLVAVNQDIDDEGYMVAEVTNTHNGHAVFFDIPASVSPAGTVDIDYDLISSNIIIARDKIL